MPSLFEPQVATAILERLEKFTPNHERKWGKMNNAQVLTHLRTVLELGTGDRVEKTTLMGKILGPFIKKVVMNEKPYKPSLPTGANFIIKEEKNFEEEKAKLIAVYKKFIERGEAKVEGLKHPLFGKLTAYEWGFSQWKHFDHHLNQFSA